MREAEVSLQMPKEREFRASLGLLLLWIRRFKNHRTSDQALPTVAQACFGVRVFTRAGQVPWPCSRYPGATVPCDHVLGAFPGATEARLLPFPPPAPTQPARPARRLPSPGIAGSVRLAA